jgi:gliding motility-associated-like protein
LTGIHPILPRPDFLFLLLFVFSAQPAKSQCTNGTQPECKCSTAPVLCTIDELDGYTFSMAAYQHPNDGPTPICPGANMTQTNNPTWFAFTAWCTNLTLRVTSTNCHQSGGAVGFQLAIYTNCTFNHVIACNADVDECNTNDKILNLTGLTIGAVYYFMVDGCLGSYCTVTIDIIGVCGQEVIDPWTLPVAGNLDPCIGDSEIYSVEDLDGARIYHWFIDGVQSAQTTTDSFNILWTTPGTYQLCIDASNDPCVPVSSPPPPLCTTIEVHSSDAGILNVSPTLLCPNESAQIATSGFTNSADNTQIIIVTDDKGTIVDVIHATSGSFTSTSGGMFIVYAYNYVISGGILPVPGSQINDINCSSSCCDLESQVIMFQSIQAVVSDILCDDHGTGNDSTDDTFTFNVLVTGSLVGTLWRSTDGTITGVYGTLQKCGPYLISGGSLNFDLHDYDVPTCFTSITVDPPLSCSSCPQTIDAGPGGSLSCYNPTFTLMGSSSATGVYQWTGPDFFTSNSLVTEVADPGWYYLSGVYQKQCSALDSSFIDLDNETPVADAGADQLIDCNHANVMIDGSGSIGNNLQFEWTNSDGAVISTQASFQVSITGTYILQLTNAVNGCASVDSVDVFIDPNALRQVSFIALPENCEGENDGMIEVTNVSGGLPPFSYSLNALIGNSSGQFNNLVPEVYQLMIMDAAGCSLDTFITILPGIDLQLTLPDTIKVKEDQSATIHATVNVPEANLVSIQWSPSGILSCDTCLSTVIKPNQNQTLQLTVVHPNGCIATAELVIIIIPTPHIYVPNTFSPNGDGQNDLFAVFFNDGVTSLLELNIFDRWGDYIYHTRNINSGTPGWGWDGKFHQKDMPSGIFVYSIKLLLADGTEKMLTGDVMLVR